ncbi:MAG: hypothetical protein AMS24_02420 [Chlamydiae bacterium SM23_39]|nr:MAG: hypothetical protein AMS24_02420 [Chlamydiae bacterium SM23_39]
MQKSSLALIVSVIFLFSIGLLTIFNVTSAEILDKSLNISTYKYFVRQLSAFFCGILIGFFVYKIGYNNIIRISPFLFFLVIMLLFLVFVPHVGIEKNGAKRWIGTHMFSFQPSELSKYLIPIYAINYFSFRDHRYELMHFLKFLFILIIPISLIIFEPDNGSIAIILSTLLVLFFLFRIKMHFWVFPLIVISIIGGVIAYNMPYVKKRISSYLNPELDIKGRGHQPYQSKIAIGSGRVYGRGFGESLQKLNYLPQSKSDYIVAIYAEEFGFIGIVVLIFIYLFITYLGFYIAINALSENGFYLASMMAFLISFQAFLNFGVVSGLLPSKGTTLPFFSHGGTSLILNIIAVFLILSVAAEKKCYLKNL